jgi:phosphoribosylaminoimidazole synthetase
VCYKIKLGSLRQEDIELIDTNILGVYCVPESYGRNTKSKKVRFDLFFRNKLNKVHSDTLNNNLSNELGLIYGSCNQEDDHLYTDTSRTLILHSANDDLYKAYNEVYRNIDDVISRLKYRSDISANFLSKYELAGVSINTANSSLKSIKEYLQSTYNSNVKSELGDFGGVYKLGDFNIVSSIDGVGTKTDFVDKYFDKSAYEGLGQDIVNHCINDILVMGARPLFFLDYYGASVLDKTQFNYFIKGASSALNISENMKVPLIGGETAEMPSVYKNKKNDIVGCILGALDNLFVNFPRKPKSGDRLFSLVSVSPHTNGFSLINKVDWDNVFAKENLIHGLDKTSFLDILKIPHKNYFGIVDYFITTYGNTSIINMCHITGGGLQENLQRVIPENLDITFDEKMLQNLYPPWCKVVEEFANVSKEEMYRVYNCGIGFVFILNNEVADKVVQDKKFKLYEIGQIN